MLILIKSLVTATILENSFYLYVNELITCQSLANQVCVNRINPCLVYEITYNNILELDNLMFHLEKKSEVFSCFLKVKSLAERETSRKIKWLRFDGEKEYFSDQFSSYLQKWKEFDMNSFAHTFSFL